jgi:hypothetical protein
MVNTTLFLHDIFTGFCFDKKGGVNKISMERVKWTSGAPYVRAQSTEAHYQVGFYLASGIAWDYKDMVFMDFYSRHSSDEKS